MKGLLIQEFKTLFRSPAAVSILIIPVVLMIGLGYLLPSGWIVPSAVTIGIVASVLLYFGGSLEEIKRTSFMKSISLTRLNKFSFLAIKILFSILISVISVIWVLLFAWIFTVPVGFLAEDFSHLIPPTKDEGFQLVKLSFEIDWTKINWPMMIYAGVVTIIVSITIAFVFVAFSKSSLSFYLLSFGYLLSMLLFGGVVMPSFLIDKDTNGWFTYLYYIIPNYYTNNIMAASFSGGLIPSVVNNITQDLDKWLNDNTDIAKAVIEARYSDEFIMAMVNDKDTLDFINSVIGLNFNKINGITVDGVALDSYKDITNASQLINYILVNNVNSISISYKTIGVIKEFSLNDTTILKENMSNLLPAHEAYINFLYSLQSRIGWTGIDAMLIHDALVKGKSFEVVSSLLTLIDNNPKVFNLLEKILVEGISISGIGGSVIGSIGPFISADIFNTVTNLVSTIKNSYGNVLVTDYVVPWVETIIFLIISAKFFKWA